MTRLPPGSRLSLWPLGVLMVIMMTMVIVMMILMLTILMKLMIDVTAVAQEEEQGWKRH